MKKSLLFAPEGGEETKSSGKEGGVLAGVVKEMIEKEKAVEEIPEPAKEGEKEEEKPPAKEAAPEKEEKKEEIHSNEFDPSSFDEASLVTKKGNPVSSAVTDVIKQFKVKAVEAKAKIAELEEKVKSLPAKIDETPEWQNLRKERDELKERFDTEYFYESEEFVSAFVKPVKDIEATIQKYVDSIDRDDVNDFNNSIAIAHQALKKGDEIAFDEAVDKITDDYFTSSVGKKFSKAMQELYVKYEEHNQAVKGKEEARKKIADKRSKQSTESSSSLDSFISASNEDFLLKNKDIVEAFDKDPALSKKYSYRETISKESAKASAAVKNFISTGSINSDLASIIQAGTLLPARVFEIQVQNEMLAGLIKTSKTQQDEIKSLSDKIIALTSVGKPRPRQFDSIGEKESEKKGGSILAAAIKRAGE